MIKKLLCLLGISSLVQAVPIGTIQLRESLQPGSTFYVSSGTVNSSFNVNGTNKFKSPLVVNQPGSGTVSTDIDLNQGSSTNGIIKQLWYSNTLPNTFNTPMVIHENDSTDLSGTAFTDAYVDGHHGFSVFAGTNTPNSFSAGTSLASPDITVSTQGYVSVVHSIHWPDGTVQVSSPTGSGSGSGSGGGIVSPGTFTWQNTKGISVSTLTVTSTATVAALSMSGSGNPTFTVNQNANNYQIVGTSVAPTAGQCGVFTSSFSIQGQSCSGAANAFISNSNTPQTATMNITSATFSNSINVFSTTTPLNVFSTIENPLVWIDLQSAVASYPGAQTEGLFVDVLDTGTHTNPLNDLVGIHGSARQFSGSDSQLIGGLFDAYGQGPGSPNIAAIYAVPAWASDLPAGTTSIMIGINITPSVTSLDGLTNRSTGTIMGIHIPDFTGGTGAPGQNWPIYIDNPYPSFFNGPISIGQANPAARFEVTSSSVSQYVMIVATAPYNSFNPTLDPSDYVLTIDTNGSESMKGNLGAQSIYLAGKTGSIVGISSSSEIVLNGFQGFSGQLLTSAGGGAIPTWSNPGIQNQNTPQVAAFNVTSGTFAGSINVFSTSTPRNRYSTIENPLVWIDQQSAIASYAGAQTSGLFVNVLDTGTHTNALNDLIAIHGLARQFSNSDSQLIAGWFDAYGQGPGSPNISAIYAVPAWASDLATGTTSQMIGINITPRVTSLDGLTNKSTGTVIGLHIPDFTSGKGAPGQNWPLYIDNPYPSFFNGPISIGQTTPIANFTIAASTTQAYAMIIGTVPYNTFNSAMPASAYVMSVTTGGIVNSHGIHNFLSTVNITTNAVVGSATYYADGTIVGAKLTQSMPALTGDITSSAGSVATTAAAAQPNITSLTTTSAFSIPSSSVTLNGARAYLAIANGLGGTAGLSLQGTAVSGTGFAPGLLGNNLSWNDGLSVWSIANNFGTNFSGLLFRGSGDIALVGTNSQAANTTLTDAQMMAKVHFYQTGPLGLTGIGMGATAPTLAQFQVTGTTTTTLAMAVSTSAVGPFFVDVSTMGILGFQDQQSSPTLSGCGTSPSIIGNNQNMEITGGTGSTGCTVTFTGGTYKLRPICLATPETGSVTNAFTYSYTASAVTITQTGLGTGKVSIRCTGRD